ncbi:MAG: ribosome assembly factor SBDS [archaeon]
MVSVDKATTVRIERNGKKFEILVDPDKALLFKQGQKWGMESLLAVNEIFKDSRAAEKASSSDIKSAFGTDDIFKAAEAILSGGELSLTVEQKRKIIEDKRRQVVSIIARNAVNPQTGMPHPPARIETSMEEAHIHIDPNKSADEQISEILKALRPIIPIKFEKKRIACKFPAVHAPRAIGLVKRFAELKRDSWLPDGSWVCEVELPAGMMQEFIDAINRESKGEVETKVLEGTI